MISYVYKEIVHVYMIVYGIIVHRLRDKVTTLLIVILKPLCPNINTGYTV